MFNMGTFFIFCILFVAVNSHRILTSDTLTRGSSLSADQNNVVLTSPSGVFSAGFFPVGINAYCFAVWFNDPHHRTVVWTANRDIPVNGKASRLILSKSGDLVLTDGGLSVVWTAETAFRRLPSPIELRIQDSGNLVLLSSDGDALWQSFDSPTDTILPNQPITRHAKLVSSQTLTDFSSGSYKLFFDTDNVLRLAFDDGILSSVYWPFPWILTWQARRSTYNNSKIAVLDSLGNFSSSDDFTFVSSDYGERNVHRRLKLDHDGNVRLYSRINNPKSEWVVTWQAFSNPCRIHGVCGPNSLCRYSPSGRSCSCLEGHKMKNFADWSKGCKPEFELPCNASESRFVRIPNMEFYGYDYGIYYNYTLRECKNVCLNLCHCKGFQYSFYAADGSFRCFPKMSLNNGYRRPGFSGAVYARLPNTTTERGSPFRPPTKNCFGESTVFIARVYEIQRENEAVTFALWLACGVAGLEIVCVAFVWWFLVRRRVSTRADTSGFRRFSFHELKKATSGFSTEVGRGSEGTVYKGVLWDSRVAAVKRLDNNLSGGEAEFLAEVNSIGRVNHMNLIEMWGFCAEGKHRLLVYEYMDRGSLKDNISQKALGSQKRFEIAVGTAKGLAYLHEECLEWVLHCDVKPENILLSAECQPKVADFGLSKLLKRGDDNEPCFSRIRGTRGYMAPEWVTNKPITSKVDVYSFGVVLLELLTGKSPVFYDKSCGRGVVRWVKESVSACGGEMAMVLEKIVDASMGGNYDEERMGVMLMVALCCVEEERDERPTMRQVVEMLQYH